MIFAEWGPGISLEGLRKSAEKDKEDHLQLNLTPLSNFKEETSDEEQGESVSQVTNARKSVQSNAVDTILNQLQKKR